MLEGKPLPVAGADLKVPEGMQDDVVGMVRDVAKIAGLQSDKAQAVLDHVHKAIEASATQRAAKRAEQFADDLFADAEFGGAQFERTVADSQAFVNRFVPEQHRHLYSAELHASLRIAMARAHREISPDQFVRGNAGAGFTPGSDSDGALSFQRSLGRASGN